ESALPRVLTAGAADRLILADRKSKLISMSMLGLAAAAAAICSRSPGVSEWAVRFLTESRSFFSAVPAVSAGVKVRLRVGMGVRALTICSSVSGSAAEAGPRAAKNTAKAATAKAVGHLNIP